VQNKIANDIVLKCKQRKKTIIMEQLRLEKATLEIYNLDEILKKKRY